MATPECILAFGREIRRRRKAQGLTLERLGEAAGLTPNYIGNIEAGQRDPSLSSMNRLARAFHSPLGELLGMPEMSADSLEAARLLSALPAEVREPVVDALRALADALRGRAPRASLRPRGSSRERSTPRNAPTDAERHAPAARITET